MCVCAPAPHFAWTTHSLARSLALVIPRERLVKGAAAAFCVQGCCPSLERNYYGRSLWQSILGFNKLVKATTITATQHWASGGAIYSTGAPSLTSLVPVLLSGCRIVWLCSVGVVLPLLSAPQLFWREIFMTDGIPSYLEFPITDDSSKEFF